MHAIEAADSEGIRVATIRVPELRDEGAVLRRVVAAVIKSDRNYSGSSGNRVGDLTR
jgi:hypothetical protein